MYTLKPINNIWPNIDLPTCMYRTKTIFNTHSDSSFSNTNIEFNELDRLAARQEKILLQLADFKKQLQTIRGELKLCAKPPQPRTATTIASKSLDKTQLRDFVVFANPSNVPYSLLAFRRLWKGQINLQIDIFTHSNITELTEQAKNFIDTVKTTSEVGSALPTLKVTLIWKNVGTNPEVIVAPTSYLPILGEANLIRFLTRIGPNDYESLPTANEVDAVMDTCHQLLNAASAKDRQNCIRILNAKLGKSEFFTGGAANNLSTADVAVSSAVAQLRCSKDVTPAMAKWLQRVAPIVGYH